MLLLLSPLDIDECAAKMHYCHANTVCVNLAGLYRCDCVPGYIRVDDFSCTGEHAEATLVFNPSLHPMCVVKFSSRCTLYYRNPAGFSLALFYPPLWRKK